MAHRLFKLKLSRIALTCSLAWCVGGGMAASSTVSNKIAAQAETATVDDIPDASTVNQDQATVNAIINAAQSGGFNSIRDRIADLNAIIDRAPASLRAVEARNGIVYVRVVDDKECAAKTAILMVKGVIGATKNGKWTCVPNPYSISAFILGSYLNEVRMPEESIATLDRGLVWSPDYLSLIGEKGVALNMMHRSQQAYQTYSSGMAAVSQSTPPHERGVLLRGEGYALVELHRYDEAEVAYREALKVDPAHGHAAEELVYIASVKAGHPKSTPMQITSDVPAANPK